MDKELLGKWAQIKGQPYPGLWFVFQADGMYEAFFEEMSLESKGTYIAQDGIIDMDQAEHTFGLTGRFKGRYAIKDNLLRMVIRKPGEARPDDLSDARIYKRVE